MASSQLRLDIFSQPGLTSPRVAAAVEALASQSGIEARHCAQKSPANWYRTIDRIFPALARKPKLLIPDIKGAAHIVYEPGELYPHHNLYYVTSETWDLRALQAVLLSEVTRLFMATYSTKMRGGYLRFQAQYLRRLRIPEWRDVPEPLRAELIEAATQRDIAACNRATFRLYGLTKEEESALGGNGVTDCQRGVRTRPPQGRSRSHRNSVKTSAQRRVHDTADTEEMLYRHYVLENIRRGRQDASKGNTESAEEVLKDIQSW